MAETVVMLEYESLRKAIRETAWLRPLGAGQAQLLSQKQSTLHVSEALKRKAGMTAIIRFVSIKDTGLLAQHRLQATQTYTVSLKKDADGTVLTDLYTWKPIGNAQQALQRGFMQFVWLTLIVVLLACLGWLFYWGT